MENAITARAKRLANCYVTKHSDIFAAEAFYTQKHSVAEEGIRLVSMDRSNPDMYSLEPEKWLAEDANPVHVRKRQTWMFGSPMALPKVKEVEFVTIGAHQIYVPSSLHEIVLEINYPRAF